MSDKRATAAPPNLTSLLVPERPQGGDDGVRGEAQGQLHRQLSPGGAGPWGGAGPHGHLQPVHPLPHPAEGTGTRWRAILARGDSQQWGPPLPSLLKGFLGAAGRWGVLAARSRLSWEMLGFTETARAPSRCSPTLGWLKAASWSTGPRVPREGDSLWHQCTEFAWPQPHLG